MNAKVIKQNGQRRRRGSVKNNMKIFVQVEKFVNEWEGIKTCKYKSSIHFGSFVWSGSGVLS